MQPPDVLDATGLSCPLPVLRAHKRLRGMSSGALLELLSTDPVSVREVPQFCEQANITLVEMREQSPNLWRFTLRKG